MSRPINSPRHPAVDCSSFCQNRRSAGLHYLRNLLRSIVAAMQASGTAILEKIGYSSRSAMLSVMNGPSVS
jgi:hypothetical protein